VQAIQSVDVKARVTGILQRVGFQGGQDLQAGALLYQIDRDYQVADCRPHGAARRSPPPASGPISGTPFP
jgi:multidrug resistance efflux pump